jgi:hypothetical protein
MVCGQGRRRGLWASSLVLACGCSSTLDLAAVTRVDVFAGQAWFVALGRPGVAQDPTSAVVIASDGAALAPGEVVAGALYVAPRDGETLRACTAAEPEALVGARLAPEPTRATLVLSCVPLASGATVAPSLALVADAEEGP